MNQPKLKPPSYKIISSVAMENQGYSLTVLNLAKFKTIISISKDEIVATGTINSQNIEFKSLEDLESGISEIYVIIPGINHKGNISLTLKSELVSYPITITEEDCYNLYSLYYGQNFETLNSANDFCNAWSITPVISQNEIQGKYLEANSSSVRGGYLYSITDLNIPKTGSYILEFEALIATTNNYSNSTFYILAEKTNINSYILKMDSNTYNNGGNNLTWKKMIQKVLFLFQ